MKLKFRSATKPLLTWPANQHVIAVTGGRFIGKKYKWKKEKGLFKLKTKNSSLATWYLGSTYAVNHPF